MAPVNYREIKANNNNNNNSIMEVVEGPACVSVWDWQATVHE